MPTPSPIADPPGESHHHTDAGSDPGCGSMTERDCADAIAEIHRFLDGELDDVVMVQIEAHLHRCAPCLDAFDFEVELRRVVAARCTEQVTPEVRERFCRMLRDLGVTSSGVPPATEPS